MTKLRGVCILVVVVALTSAVAAVLSAQTSIDRRVPWSSKLPLKEAIRHGDTNVLVLNPEHRDPLVEEADAEEELLVRAEHADEVFVAEIAAVTPTMKENGTWVTTTISARVIQMLKHDLRFPEPTSPNLQLVHDGGGISINGVDVKVGVYPVVRPRERYLMFIVYNSTDFTRYAGPAFLIDRSGKLVHSETSVDGPLPSVLNGMNLANVIKLLRRK